MKIPSLHHYCHLISGMLALIGLAAPASAQAPHRVPTGTLSVEELNTNNTAEAIVITPSVATSPGVQVAPGASNRGDYFVNLPGADDAAQGLLVSSVASLTPKATSQIEVTSNGRYFIPVHDMEMGEVNVDVSFGWFRYDEWLAARTVKSGGSIFLAGKSPLIEPGTHFSENGSGTSMIDLRGLGASSDDGILLVNHAANAGFFANVETLPDGRFAIYCIDPRNGAFNYVSEPVSFVYLPTSAVGQKGLVALGRINGDASTDISGGIFEVNRSDNESWHLEVFTDETRTTKHSPKTGSLLLSGGGNDGRNVDNRVAAEWDETARHWVIESYDVNQDFVQDLLGSEDLCSFAFFESPRANLRFDTDTRTLSVYDETSESFEDAGGTFRGTMPYEVATREGIVTFTFGNDFILEERDRVVCVGSKPLSIVTARDLIVPAGASLDASARGILAGPGGGLGGQGGEGGAGGAGGRESEADGGTAGGGGPGGTNDSRNGKVGGGGGRGQSEIGFRGTVGKAGTNGLPGFGVSAGGGIAENAAEGIGGMGGFVGNLGGGGQGGAGGIWRLAAQGANGSPGADGVVGGTGGTGNRGGRGGIGEAGRHAGSGLRLIGGAGGSGGRGGSGGGGGGSGRGGGGGGGGGGEADSALNDGTRGGDGAKGGNGATGGQGGKGTEGGQGGAGGGALSLTAYRHLEVRGFLVATGGEGGKYADRVSENLGRNGNRANGAIHEGDRAANHSRPKTDGGDGADGGNGGRGAEGGLGGEGGAGSGGTILLQGLTVVTDGGLVSVTGGSAGGGNGRVVISESGPETFAMTNLGGSLEEFPGLIAVNPHWSTRGETPLIDGLKGGAAIAGVLNGVNAGSFPPPANESPVLGIQRQPTFAGLTYPGYHWLFLINHTDEALSAPVLGMGAAGFLSRLIDGGLETEEAFGGDGAGVLPALPPYEVYATLIPTSVTQVNFGFTLGSLYLEGETTASQASLGENANPGGEVPPPVTEEFTIPGYPADGDDLNFQITGEVQVVINPPAAVEAGARWQIEGASGLYDTSEILGDVPLGVKTITFPVIEGWLPPAAVSINVLPQGVISTVEVTFTEASEGIVGAIPPLTVSDGGAIGMTFPAGTTLEVVSGNPQGNLFINGNGWFYYDSGSDRTPFEVRFTHNGVSQVVLITPEPALVPEEEIIALLPQPDSLPAPSGFDYNHIHSVPGEGLLHGATDNTDTRIVTLSGKQVVFENSTGPSGRMFKEVNGATRFVEELHIYADEVVFRDALHVPETKVTIFARKISFPNEKGQLITTPADVSGALDAGNITLRVLEIDAAPGDRPRFVLNPGAQSGGPGQLTSPFEGMAPFTENHGGPAPALLDENETGRIGFCWLHPIAVRAALGYAKDIYFLGFLTEAEESFAFYKDYLSQLAQPANLPVLDGETLPAIDFAELENDVDRHLARLADGLDYYGNEAGWVPLLSFETNFLLTDNLIDQAIRALYVSYWITRTSDYLQDQETALREAEAQLQQENALLRNRMTELVGDPANNITGLIDQLEAEEGVLQAKLDTLGGKLATLEEQLLQQAEDLQKKEDRKAAIKKGVRVMGSIMQVVPVGQPALAAAGAGLDLVTRIDEQDPLDSIVQGISIAGNYKMATLKTQARDLDEKMNPPVFGPVTEDEANRQKYLEQARNLETGLNLVQQGSDELQGFLASNSAPLEGVQGKLEMLKQENARFQEIAGEIEEVTLEKQAFTARLVSAQNEVRELPGLIMKNALAARKINESASQTGGVLDPQALSVIEEMERRAKDRLRKQFYLLAKAYEYRVVESYRTVGDEAFDPVDVFLKIVAIIEAAEGIAGNPLDDEVNATNPGSPHIINPAGFDTLKEVFRVRLQAFADRIVFDYGRLGNERSRTAPAVLIFDDAQIDLLNGDFRKVTVNLDREGLLGVNREMHRIRDLTLAHLDFSLTLNGETTTATEAGLANGSLVEIQILHTGRSVLKKNGRSFVFNHYTKESAESNPIKWVFEVDLVTGEITPNNPSFASQSLLTALLGEDGDLSIQRFSRPGAIADLAVCVLTVDPQWQGAPTGNLGVQIDGLTLEAGIDYFDAGGFPETEIKVQDENGRPLEISPRFLFDPVVGTELPEVIGRRDGLGELTRSFSASSFDISPQAFFGNTLTLDSDQPNGFEFSHWLSQTGGQIGHPSERFNPLGDYLKAPSTAGTADSQTLVVDNDLTGTNNNKRFIAVYRFVGDTEAPEVQDIVLDAAQSDETKTTYLVSFNEEVGGVDGDDFLAMDGGQPLAITNTQRIGTQWRVQVAGQPSFFALIDNDSILDEAGNSLAGRGVGNGNFEFDGTVAQPSQVILSLDRFLPDGSPVLKISGPATTSLTLSWSPDLSEGSWQTLTNLTLENVAAEYTDNRPNLTAKGFYRVSVSP